MPLDICKTTVFPGFVYFTSKVLVRFKVLKYINSIEIYNKSFSIKTFDVHQRLEQSCNSGQQKHYVTHCRDVITDVIQHSNILKHYDTWKIFTSCHLVPNNILGAKRFSFPPHTNVQECQLYDSCLWITPGGLRFTGNNSNPGKSGQWSDFKGTWVIGKIMQEQAKYSTLTSFSFIRFQIAGNNYFFVMANLSYLRAWLHPDVQLQLY